MQKRLITIFTGQWADLDFETLCQKMQRFGFDGLEIACWGDHFEVQKALRDSDYCQHKWEILKKYGLQCVAISNHLVGQAVCDIIDQRHKNILPSHVWGDGNPEGVNQRASKEMIDTAYAAKKFGVDLVVGFTGSPIWNFVYPFPPVSKDLVDEGFGLFAKMWKPILDEYHKLGIKFALEVHPTEIAFDIVTAQKALDALNYHPAFGFNFDPSHLCYQGVDPVKFILKFGSRIYHVHLKDVAWSHSFKESGIFGGHLCFGDPRRFWDFRSLGRGGVDFESIIRALNSVGYSGPLSVEWEDNYMDREYGAKEACEYAKKLNYPFSNISSFDSAFEK